ncbi:hypothetical protein OL229_01155 [Neisseriaceae bacterium JH1-16]|nr:hypothetical protein [Neisseriaceae bacterium JH1-16]
MDISLHNPMQYMQNKYPKIIRTSFTLASFTPIHPESGTVERIIMLIRRLYRLSLRRARRAMQESLLTSKQLAAATDDLLGCSPWWPEPVNHAHSTVADQKPVTVERQWHSYRHHGAAETASEG